MTRFLLATLALTVALARNVRTGDKRWDHPRPRPLSFRAYVFDDSFSRKFLDIFASDGRRKVSSNSKQHSDPYMEGKKILTPVVKQARDIMKKQIINPVAKKIIGPGARQTNKKIIGLANRAVQKTLNTATEKATRAMDPSIKFAHRRGRNLRRFSNKKIFEPITKVSVKVIDPVGKHVRKHLKKEGEHARRFLKQDVKDAKRTSVRLGKTVMKSAKNPRRTICRMTRVTRNMKFARREGERINTKVNKRLVTPIRGPLGKHVPKDIKKRGEKLRRIVKNDVKTIRRTIEDTYHHPGEAVRKVKARSTKKLHSFERSSDTTMIKPIRKMSGKFIDPVGKRVPPKIKKAGSKVGRMAKTTVTKLGKTAGRTVDAVTGDMGRGAKAGGKVLRKTSATIRKIIECDTCGKKASKTAHRAPPAVGLWEVDM